MEHGFMWMLGQLEILGEVELGIMRDGIRSQEIFIHASVKHTTLTDGTIAIGLASNGKSVEECVEKLFREATELKLPKCIRVDEPHSTVRKYTFNHFLQSWVPVGRPREPRT